MVRRRHWILLLAWTGVVAVLVAIGLSGAAPRHIPADLRNGRAFIQDNLTSAKGRQYAVWVAPNGVPYAGERARGGEWRVQNLARIRGNPLAAPTVRDSHNVYAIGVDRSGSVHVAGNMRVSPLRYVRSGGPGIGDWRTQPAPFIEEPVSYPAFTTAPSGNLLFWARLGSVRVAARVVLSAQRPDGTWELPRTILDGRPTSESPYLHRIAVDRRRDTIHLMFVWRDSTRVGQNEDVGYARSVDGGLTWQTSRGRPLSLPITHPTAETVIETRPGSGLLNQGGLTVDSHGHPHGVVTYSRAGGEQTLVHVWNAGRGWRTRRYSDLGLNGRPQVVGTPDGRVWLVGVDGQELTALDITPRRSYRKTKVLARVPRGWEASYDARGLGRSGRLDMLVPERARPNVISVQLPG